MNAPIRVARVEEMPPGTGKTVQLGHRTITVYNAEGRYFADVERHIGGGDLVPPARCMPACVPHGQRFSATAPDSPARRIGYERRYHATAEGDYVILWLDEAA